MYVSLVILCIRMMLSLMYCASILVVISISFP